MTDPSYPEGPPPAPAPASPWAPPEQDLVPASPPASRLPRALALAGGLVVLGAGGAFALQAFGDDQTGAATPEDAARRLVEAVADEDVLGVIDLLPDGERELLRDVTTSARDEYQRLGLLSDTFSLDGFAGVDITVQDIEVEVEVITEGLAQVFVTDGEFAVEVDGEELVGNLGEVVEAVAEARDVELEVDDVEDRADADEAGMTFVVVEEDGRWHPSVGFTIAELARTSSFEPVDAPDLDDGVRPDGADSPEAAVQALLDAAGDLDAEAALATLDPGELRAAHVYAELFLPDDADVPDDVEITAELTAADVEDLGGGASRVVPTGFELRFEADGGTAEVVLADGCTRVDVQPPPGEGEAIDEELCLGDDVEDVLPEELADVEVPEELQEVAEAFLPLRFGIVTVERDGEHFVAPIRTLADVLIGFTRGLEREDVEPGGAVFALLSGELDDEVEDLLDQLFETAFGFEELEDFEDFEEFEDFDDPLDDGDGPARVPTGASGPNGELLVFDAVEGSVGEDASATFLAVADADDRFVIGAEGLDGFDGRIVVFDADTGEELAANDDHNGFDPEVLVDLRAGQLVEIVVDGFAGEAGAFVVYFEPF